MAAILAIRFLFICNFISVMISLFLFILSISAFKSANNAYIYMGFLFFLPGLRSLKHICYQLFLFLPEIPSDYPVVSFFSTSTASFYSIITAYILYVASYISFFFFFFHLLFFLLFAQVFKIFSMFKISLPCFFAIFHFV